MWLWACFIFFSLSTQKALVFSSVKCRKCLPRRTVKTWNMSGKHLAHSTWQTLLSACAFGSCVVSVTLSHCPGCGLSLLRGTQSSKARFFVSPESSQRSAAPQMYPSVSLHRHMNNLNIESVIRQLKKEDPFRLSTAQVSNNDLFPSEISNYKLWGPALFLTFKRTAICCSSCKGKRAANAPKRAGTRSRAHAACRWPR